MFLTVKLYTHAKLSCCSKWNYMYKNGFGVK